MGVFCLDDWGTRITKYLPVFCPSRHASHVQICSIQICWTRLKYRTRIQIKKAPKKGLFCVAGEQGFEPWLAESESAVLPLDDSPMWLRINIFLTPYSEARLLYNNSTPSSEVDCIKIKKILEPYNLAQQNRKWSDLIQLEYPERTTWRYLDI